MFDLVIKGGRVVDGTGTPARLADVAVQDGRIVRVGRVRERARREIDAEGLVVAPGIVDVHTHYDPQLTWDASCDTSVLHGVTTVIVGNCGFSVAPCRPADRAYTAQLFARVEGMDLAALDHIQWEFETFGEYLAAINGRLAVNVGVYAAHSAIRRYVMGDASFERPANPEEMASILRVLEESLEAGAMGWSSSHAPTHLDLADRPVPSRLATVAEIRAMADVVGRIGRGSIAYAPASAVEGISADDRALLIELAERSGVAVITQGLGGRNKVDAPDLAWEQTAEFLDSSTRVGSPVYCLLNTRGTNGPFTLAGTSTRFEGVPLWRQFFNMDPSLRMGYLRDPQARSDMKAAMDHPNLDPDAGSTLPPPTWDMVTVDEVHTAQNRALVGRSIAEIARERAQHPAEVLFDVGLVDDLATTFRWSAESGAWADLMRRAQRHPNMIVGISDGGAHLDRDDGTAWSTQFLARWWRDEGLWRLEDAVRLLSAVPASICQVPGRGVLSPGWQADMMVFDPDRLGVGRAKLERDRGSNTPRFRSEPTGFRATVVNGVPVVENGEPTGDLPGSVVRPSGS